MSDTAALMFYSGVVYVAFIGSVALPRSNPITKGSMRVLAVTFLVLVIETYRSGPI